MLASFSPALSCLCRVDLPAQIGLQQFTVDTVKLFLAYVYKGETICRLIQVKALFVKSWKPLIFSRKCNTKIQRLIGEYTYFACYISVGSVDVGAEGSAAHKKFSQLLQYLSETRNIEIIPLGSTGKPIPKFDVPKMITTL